MEAISEFQYLLKHRPDPSFWEANIISAHSLCQNKADHRLFYKFLCTPRGQFKSSATQETGTLGDFIDSENFVNPINELPDELTQDIYQNGNEITIRTRRKSVDTNSDDEKLIE